ncbi:uncharacterized protein LOC125222642 [Salvia hispanica]|uniref:uncharacterized protein LOC125222642 n=1 Tax=Salvia hispanica TaxID=49212 RepID=UPI002009CA39|nr:uncharacterized protein LOC125222642 [Salvia hispanica]
MKENFRCWISEYNTEMAVEASLGNYVASPSAEHVKSTGKSAAGSQVSNSGDGVYCHQCRQKTRAPAAACKNLAKKKLCSVKMCCRCLWNRRRKGLQPMGVLTRAAKATGKDVLSARKKGRKGRKVWI